MHAQGREFIFFFGGEVRGGRCMSVRSKLLLPAGVGVVSLPVSLRLVLPMYFNVVSVRGYRCTLCA